MYHIDFHAPIHVYFIGIGGISMSGLAEILLSKSFHVSGSDIKKTELTDTLTDKGAVVFIGHNKNNLSDKPDLVVYTAAVKEDNCELMEARNQSIPILSRAELLGQIMKNYSLPIAVSGTHGKTTTTSLLSSILLKNNNDPTLSIGGILRTIGGNIRVGNSEYFVTEACEYTNSFLNFFPKLAIILNIEEDHMDFFKNIGEIRSSFHKFAMKIPSDGCLVINGDIPDHEEITRGLACKIITVGSNSSFDYSTSAISYDNHALPKYDLLKDGSFIDTIQLRIPGKHNVYNSLAAIALSMELGIPLPVIKEALLAFTGTDRRFELKGTLKGITIIDDYAHHPTEIAATLSAARNIPHKKLWCIFQPHTYTRTNYFAKEFAKTLSNADAVILTDIYAAREKNQLNISSDTILKELHNSGVESYYFPSFDEIQTFILKKCNPGDLLITMGAGDVYIIGEKLLGL